MFCARGHIFGGTKGVGSRIHVLRSRTHFRRYLGRRVRFSCFALPNSFSAVPRASGPIFMFFAPRLIFCGTEGIGSRFHVLRSRTRFWRYGGRRVPFSCFARQIHFRWYVGRRVPFSCFARSDSFSAVPGASGPVFMFCAPDSFSVVPRASGQFIIICPLGLIFGGTEGVGSRFKVLRAQTRFRR
jgi:hypothetical protein